MVLQDLGRQGVATDMQANDVLIILHSVLPSVAICAGIMTVFMRPSKMKGAKAQTLGGDGCGVCMHTGI